jgi:putative hydrolase of the HAD superfamily
MIEAVFFDLFETLITEFDPNWKPGPSVAERLGVDEKVFRMEMQARQKKRYIGVFPDYPSVLRDVCQVTGRSTHPRPLPRGESVDEVIKKLNAERLATKAAPFACIEDDVIHALKSIKQMKLKIGLISNCSPEEVVAWDTCRLSCFFDDVVFSYQVGCAKPEPKIYHLACQRLNVRPEQCIFVGDGGSDELTGASQVGMTSYFATWFLERWPYWKRSGHGRERSDLYPQLHTLAELVNIITSSSYFL